MHPCLRVHMSWCAGPLRVQCVCSQHGNRHSTHNQQIREDNRSRCSWGRSEHTCSSHSFLVPCKPEPCLERRVALPVTQPHDRPRAGGGRARSSAPAQTCAHNVFAGARALQPVAQWATLPDYLLFFNPDLISRGEGGWETIC